ncbi:hypothetical protein IYW40_07265 [Methylocystis sp. H4A]|uniref:hypothetical protein n=1 Tax=Methylocystis sp. H4A TaxID=2785788 RepID=UPI0018C344AA|nr:hypothetical protein [Methylocystis sp. H4A]MBG0801280.1 hypothetical protein [Methylocystis sp. H4A]
MDGPAMLVGNLHKLVSPFRLSYKHFLELFQGPTLRLAPTWERIMNPHPVSLRANRQAVENFDDAAKKLRHRFKSSVSEALPGSARRLFEREWQEVADLESIESMPPLVFAYLMSCERCVQDLLNKNYEGVASSYFNRCVSEAANNIRAKVIASWSYEGDVIRIPTKRTA